MKRQPRNPAYSEEMRKRLLLIAILFILPSEFFVRGKGDESNLDSLIACRATQKLIFENAFVRVIDDIIPPGVSEPKHRHPNGVVVALEDADTETHLYPDSKAARRHTKKGTATWNDAIVHDVKNVGNTPTHFIRIDLK